MKRLLLVLVVMLLVVRGWGQSFNGYPIKFDDTVNLSHIIIDSTSFINNRWQIGKPDKAVFGSAYSIPNVIVTDTLNPVPAKDTSVFYLKHYRKHTWPFVKKFELFFRYKMDGDNADFGKIEIMPDTEGVWVNVLEEDTTYDIQWYLMKPTLKGSTNGWTDVYVLMWPWSTNVNPNTYPVKCNADTVLVRFTYITDSGSTLHDGWMIDDIVVDDYGEDIIETLSPSIINIAPNPVGDVLHIKRKIGAAKNESIQVVNMMGEVVMEVVNFSGETLDVSGLAKGVYLLRYSCDKGEAFLNFEL